MMRRTFAGVALVLGLLAVATPAWAHEEINPSTFPISKPTFLTLTAANEKKVDLVSVSLMAPKGVPFGATTRQPPGWAVQRTDGSVTWSGGVVKPDSFEHWGFEVDGVDQPGPLSYKLTLGFADGKSEDAEVIINAVAPGVQGNGLQGKTLPSRTDGKATVSLVIAAAAALLALAALFAALRRRGQFASGPRETSETNDW